MKKQRFPLTASLIMAVAFLLPWNATAKPAVPSSFVQEVATLVVSNENSPSAETELIESEESETTTAILDVLPMQSDYKHKKEIVQFSHKKHLDELAIGCGECHHDSEGEPLTDLKLTDEVQPCIACHQKPGKTKDKKLNDTERLEFHAEALHQNCIVCHKAYNKEQGEKKAPQKCSKCHPKKKRTRQIEGC